MHSFIQEFTLLFEGYSKAYGFYSGELTADSGKLTGKRGSVTGAVTVELWERHLTGEMGLGIIPINENSEVKFAAIDIDDYHLDLNALNIKIEKLKLPLVMCRTKSGGAHLYLFLTKFYSAAKIQARMREMSSLLGYGGSEIFPKQTKINADRGDVGNWINMPYFNAGKTSRYGFNDKNVSLDPYKFIEYAKSKMIDPDALMKLKIEETDHLPGGPPCLNHLIGMGFPQGTRNNGLMNLGVYAKKMSPDSWEMLVEEYNRKYMTPPLESHEVIGVTKSLKKKEFFYMCKQPPISQYCNMPKCRMCKHGIGAGDTGMPKLGTLTKLLTQPPIWFIEVEGGGRLELSTHELQNQRAFQLACMTALNIMPIVPKNEIWQEIVSNLLSNVNEAEVPIEATPIGMLRAHLEDFCTNRVQAKTADDMLLGKPWTNNHFHYFRMKDFLEYLDRKKFIMQRNQIAMRLRDWGAEQRFFNIKGKGINVYVLKEFEKQEQPFDVPNQAKPTPY